MNTPKQAAFRFENYRIVEFSYQEPTGGGGDKGLTVQIDPTGFYFKKDKRFVLQLEFEAKLPDDENKTVMRALLNAVFLFNDETEIPDYFYQNSIAIVFPFLRAFVSTLTLQANATQLILPIANLSYLESPLKENTQIIEE